MPAIAPTTIHGAAQAAVATGVVAANTGARPQWLNELVDVYPLFLPAMPLVAAILYPVLCVYAIKQMRALYKKYPRLPRPTLRDNLLCFWAVWQMSLMFSWLTDDADALLSVLSSPDFPAWVRIIVLVFIAPSPVVIPLGIRAVIRQHAEVNRVMAEYKAAETEALEADAAERAVGDYSDAVDEKAPLVEVDGQEANANDARA